MLGRAYSRLRSPLHSTQILVSSRSFARSRQCASDIHSAILNILREKTSEDVENVPEKVPKGRNILILNPSETKNKDYLKYVETLARKKKSAKAAPNLEVSDSDLFSESLSRHDFDLRITEYIDNLRPGNEGKDANFSVKSAAQNLSNSFTKAQLAHYVQEKDVSYYRVSHTKAQLANTIVTKIWGEVGSTLSNVFKKESVPLSHQEMFLLLSQRGAILSLLKSTVMSLDFDPLKKELILAGTDFQIRNAKINLAHRFENVVREQIDLSTIQALYEEKFGSFTFKEIGKSIEVYFQHLDGHKYELCALGRAHVRRIQRLLVWFLDYNLHAKKTLHLPEKSDFDNSVLIPYTDDYAMSWKERSKAHFELVDETQNREKDASVAREISKFSDENLDKLGKITDFDISHDTFAETSVGDETYESLQLLNDNTLEHVIEDLVVASKPAEKDEKADINDILSEDMKSKLYTELVDFGYRQKLRGVNASQLDAPLFTTTLGRVLFEHEKSESSVLAAPSSKPDRLSPFTFNTNIPQVYDKVLREGISEVSESGESVYEDPHTYSLQFKFLPSPYAETENVSDLHENMKYPPIEMWMQLNENKVVDIESLQVVTVEGENDSYVCLPKLGSDMKISCQLTGRVIEEDEVVLDSEKSEKLRDSEDFEKELPDLEALFDAPSSKYPRLAQQEGLQAFIEGSKLNFSGKAPTSIAPFVDLVIDGKTVRYAFVSANYRRELEVKMEKNQSAQISIVDGGSLGGRRCEVRFLGDFSKGLDRGAFDSMLDNTCDYIRGL